jgi:tail fiber protein
MSISSPTSAATYTGNGVTTAYPVPFVYLDRAHVVVTRTIGEAVQVLTLGAGYTLTAPRVSSGGTVTLSAPLPNGATLTVERVVPLTQPAQLRTGGSFSPGGLEDALDLLAMGLQQEERALAAVRGRSTSLEDRASSLEERATGLEGRADTLENLAAESASDMAALDGRATGLEELTATFDTRIVAVDVRSASVESRFSAAETNVVNLQGRTDVLETRANALEAGGAGSLSGRVGAVEARATTLEGRATALESTTTSNTGRLTAVEGRATTLEATTAVVRAYYRKATTTALATGTTLLNFDIMKADSHSAVTTGAGWKFTVPAGKGGLYLVTAASTTNTTSAHQSLDLYQNGALFARGHGAIAQSAAHLTKATWLVQVVPGDTLDVRATNGGASVNTTNWEFENWVDIVRLSP